MAKLDYEKLLGGYATGTLTEAERQALFQAALKDQALFDTLADDQALKDVLDEPASRRRLIAALEALEATQDRSSRWGALVPAWLPLPAIIQTVRLEQDTVYATTPQLPAPKPRSWRGALAGGVILAALAVIVAAGLIEELTSPPQPVLTADARRIEEPLPQGAGPSQTPSPSPEVPVEPIPPRPAVELQTAPTPPQESTTEHDRPKEVLQDRALRKAVVPRAREERDAESMPAEVERKRSRELGAVMSPATGPTLPAPDMRSAMKPEPLPEPSSGAQVAGGGQEALTKRSTVRSARALFYGGAGSLESRRESFARNRPSESAKTDPSRVPMAQPYVNVSPMLSSANQSLGMRYSLLKKMPTGEDQEVSPGTMFNDDDEIRLTVEVNTAGYLYVLKRTPAEVWTVLYPSLGAMTDPAGRAAYVHSGTRYVIPSIGSLRAAGERGPAQLVLILAREPQPELGSLGAASEDRETARLSRVSDLVKRIRTDVAGGKLLLERVDSTQQGTPAERAEYVIDHSSPPVSRIVANVMLSFR